MSSEIPAVVEFGYKNFKLVDEKKWYATCNFSESVKKLLLKQEVSFQGLLSICRTYIRQSMLTIKAQKV